MNSNSPRDAKKNNTKAEGQYHFIMRAMFSTPMMYAIIVFENYTSN